jgi:hypothetical protein
MAQSRPANDVPASGHSETIDSSSTGGAKNSDSHVHMTSYIGLGIAALLLGGMLFLGGMWGF